MNGTDSRSIGGAPLGRSRAGPATLRRRRSFMAEGRRAAPWKRRRVGRCQSRSGERAGPIMARKPRGSTQRSGTFTQAAVPQSGFGRQLGSEPYVADEQHQIVLARLRKQFESGPDLADQPLSIGPVAQSQSRRLSLDLLDPDAGAPPRRTACLSRFARSGHAFAVSN